MGPDRHPHGEEPPSRDLHGMTTTRAVTEVERFLGMTRGSHQVKLIAGRGHGNRSMEPILLKHIHKWLLANKERLHVQQVQVTSHRGALLVTRCSSS